MELEYGKVDQVNLSKIDRIVEMGVRYNIRLKFCIETFRNITAEEVCAIPVFCKTQYHKRNGGPFENMYEYINSEEGHQAYLNRLKIFRDRIGDLPVVFGWELWNEVNCVGKGFEQWTETLLPEVHKMFPKNMVMQSLGSFDTGSARKYYRHVNSLPSNDVAQIHRYLDMGADLGICKGPVDMLAADAVDELRSYQTGKPVLLAEAGGVEPKHTGPIRWYENDKEGMLLHDILFAPFFSGAAGPGNVWHWDDRYVDKHDLWYHYQRFNRAVVGIDPVREHFTPVKMVEAGLRIYGLIGKNTILLWCRDIENNWETELKNGIPPSVIHERRVDISSLIPAKMIRKISTYDPWKDEWKNGEGKKSILLPDFKRSIVVKFEKKR